MLKPTAKNIKNYVLKRFQEDRIKNISIHLGKLNQNTVNALKEYFIVVPEIWGYWHFEEKIK